MKRVPFALSVAVCVVVWLSSAVTQQASPSGSAIIVPHLIRFAGVVKDSSEHRLTGVQGITFALYKEQEGGIPMWLETQNVVLDSRGNYEILLGVEHSGGVPMDLFTAGEARWLGIQVQGQPVEQPRVLLVSVPYALKAGDAETLGGKPASAFMLNPNEAATGVTRTATASSSANSATKSQTAARSNAINPAITGTGTTNFIVRWTGSTSQGNSIIFQNPTTKTIGIGTSAPQGKLSIASTNPGTGFNTLFAWNSAYSIFGPNVGSNTGAALALGYSTTDNAANIVALAPSVAWKPLRLASGGLIIDAKNGTEAMRVTSGGNVGIGTGNPGARLEIDGGNISSAGNGLNVLLGNVGCVSPTWGIVAASRTSPCSNFILGYNDAQPGTFINRPTGGAIHFKEGNSGTDQMTIVPGGNVGIGDTSPDSALHVLRGTATSGLVNNADAIAGECGGVNCVAVSAISVATGGIGLYAEGAQSGARAASFFGDAHIEGDLQVAGAITAGTKDFLIDHPLDPANKYLYHASVESSEMKNIYDGVATLDTNGQAVVQLPKWFAAINKDFRYQLTAVGAPGPNLYIAQKIQNNSFRIAGGSAGMEVSWQVTGVRQDAFAKAHPLVVEEAKNARERGFYLHPELYGAPQQKSIERARHLRMMQRMKEIKMRQLAASQRSVLQPQSKDSIK
jgi:trimeric autotransporter adhesin